MQLDSKTKEIEWNPEKNFPKEEKEDGMPIPRHSLMIKQVILSHEAADGEVAVVEAEAMGYAQSNIKTLIAVLVQGKDHQRSLDLVFHDAPVKLRLVKGSGPIHLVGAHGVGKFSLVSPFADGTVLLTLVFLRRQHTATWVMMTTTMTMMKTECQKRTWTMKIWKKRRRANLLPRGRRETSRPDRVQPREEAGSRAEGIVFLKKTSPTMFQRIS